MPLEPSAVGRTYDGITYEVGRQKLVEFAHAVGESNPVFHSRDAAVAAGYPEQVAPFTFPTVIMNISDAQVTGDPSLDIDWSTVVDGEESFAYTRPIYAGDVLRAVPRIESVRVKGSLEFLTFVTDLTSAADGEPVCVVTATLIARGDAGR